MIITTNKSDKVIIEQDYLEELFALRRRNVKDKYKEWTNDLIKQDLETKKFPMSALMCQVNQDYNLASLIRSANSWGVGTVYYYGKRRHYDKRGTVGSHHVQNVVHLKTIEEVSGLKEKYIFIGFENNIPNTICLYKFKFPQNSLIIIGEECGGISSDLYAFIDHFIEIPSYGAIRSINAACAASVAFYEAARQWDENA